ncbi:unnamed protein product [Symbiodinium sp. CCMP2592]|nr:unnamed protein product [Symbiodinium sp. CCMP2592]
MRGWREVYFGGQRGGRQTRGEVNMGPQLVAARPHCGIDMPTDVPLPLTVQARPNLVGPRVVTPRPALRPEAAHESSAPVHAAASAAAPAEQSYLEAAPAAAPAVPSEAASAAEPGPAAEDHNVVLNPPGFLKETPVAHGWSIIVLKDGSTLYVNRYARVSTFRLPTEFTPVPAAPQPDGADALYPWEVWSEFGRYADRKYWYNVETHEIAKWDVFASALEQSRERLFRERKRAADERDRQVQAELAKRRRR